MKYIGFTVVALLTISICSMEREDMAADIKKNNEKEGTVAIKGLANFNRAEKEDKIKKCARQLSIQEVRKWKRITN